MELRHLRNFILVAEMESVTQAAAHLDIAQPSLSVQMQRLEEVVGAKLFERKGRGIMLTPAGLRFIDHARRVVSEMEQGYLAARAAAKGQMGLLAIGHDAAAEFLVFPRVISSFRAEHPKVDLAFRNYRTAEIFDALLTEQIDVGFAYQPIIGAFDFQPLCDVTLALAVPVNHRLAEADEVSIQDLSGEPLIMFPRRIDPHSYALVEAEFAKNGATLNLVNVSPALLTGLNLVSIGIGCCLVGDYALQIKREGVVYKKLASGSLKRTLSIVTRKGNATPLVDGFVDFVCARFQDCTAPLQEA